MQEPIWEDSRVFLFAQVARRMQLFEPLLEETPETSPSSPAEGLLFLHGLESNPGSSLQTEEEAGLP